MLRALTAEALEDCAALFVDTFNAPPWDESWAHDDALLRLTDFLATPRSHGVRLVEPDGSLGGFALGHLERSGAEDHFLLQEMCVRRAQQRSGRGTAILRALADGLPGVEHWYLLTAREGPAAAFYTGLGFRPAGRLGVFVRP